MVDMEHAQGSIGGLPKEGDSELQDFLMMEKQKAQFNAQVGRPRLKGQVFIS